MADKRNVMAEYAASLKAKAEKNAIKKVAIEAPQEAYVGSAPPTQDQIRRLASLGHTLLPRSQKEAENLISYLSSNELEGTRFKNAAPSVKQISYLKHLGAKIIPSTRIGASRMIDSLLEARKPKR